MAKLEREPTIEELIGFWEEAKRGEKGWQDQRRLIEDEIAKHLILGELDSTQTVKAGQYKMRVTQRVNRRIDTDALQELAAENGLEAHLADLFRWKPELNLRQWNDADEGIRKALQGAITSKPGRPSFALITDEKEQ
jgi:hypothetical protein